MADLRGLQARQVMRFNVVDGPRTGENLNIPMPEPGEPPVLIGRSRDCAIWIDAPNISRRHTEIFSGSDRRPLVRDLGSVNGTLVNAQPASQTVPLPLNPGDHIRVGLSELIFMGLITDAPAPTIATMPSLGANANATTVGINVHNNPSATASLNIPLPSSASSTGTFSGMSVAPPTRAATLPGEYYVYLIMHDGGRYLIEGEEVIVGRGQANDIVIDSNSISRQHARLQRTPQGVFISDLGSTNKTFVNGTPTAGPVLLRDGDLVRFGDVEGDFRLETQRVTNLANPIVPREEKEEITAKDFPATDQTFVGMGEQTFVGNTYFDQTYISGITRTPIGGGRRAVEQSETALDLDIKIVGRALRKQNELAAQATGATGQSESIVRLEEVYLTEGTGRAQDILLNNVSLKLKAGELVALVGPSGSGKTELLQVLAGLRAANVLGRALPTTESVPGQQRPNLETDRDLTRWRMGSIGYLAGEPEFNPRQTALEHVMQVLETAGYGRDPLERSNQALEILRKVGMTNADVARMLPGDLNRTERKQVALARMLALDPPLLLLDEPTGRVPSAAAAEVFQLLRSMAAAGRTVFMVTSDLMWARAADRQIEILDGAIVTTLA
jgi:pSer/pThr/pTyr-binding forkhead associated (FHA) protein/ABC-type lipoprotein export system ATPase subunit